MLPLKPVVPSLWLPLYTFFSAQAEAEFAAFPAFPQPWEFQCGQDASEVPANPWIRTTLHARPIWHQEVQLGQRTAEVQAIPQQLSPSSWSNWKWLPLLLATLGQEFSQALLFISCSSNVLLHSGDAIEHLIYT